MGLDTHMIAGSRACSISIRLTHSTITSQSSPHYAEALPLTLGYPTPTRFAKVGTTRRDHSGMSTTAESRFSRVGDTAFSSQLDRPGRSPDVRGSHASYFTSVRMLSCIGPDAGWWSLGDGRRMACTGFGRGPFVTVVVVFGDERWFASMEAGWARGTKGAGGPVGAGLFGPCSWSVEEGASPRCDGCER